MAVTKVVMPKLSEAMESGKIIKWLKKEGDRIQGGDILAEIETDKADVEMEAFGAGVLRKILVPAGETAPVGGAGVRRAAGGCRERAGSRGRHRRDSRAAEWTGEGFAAGEEDRGSGRRGPQAHPG